MLSLFSDNREEAGRAYESLRKRLVEFFLRKSCSHAEQLADETLNRVARKASSFDPKRNFEIHSYALGFAAKVHLEYLRQPDRSAVSLEVNDKQAEDAVSSDDEDFECLDGCLQKLSPEDRDLVIRYYSKEGPEKIELRRQLAAFLGVKPEALHVRVFRIRKTLRSCLRDCMKKMR